MNILVAEDEDAIRKGLNAFLRQQGHEVITAADGTEALNRCADFSPDLVISDIRMPEMDGIELLKRIRGSGSQTPVIIITSYATVKTAVEAMKSGADDFLTKPLDLEELTLKIDKIRTRSALLLENLNLKTRLETLENPIIVGCSPVMDRVRALISLIAADPDIPVMIYGESGTGKELAARTVHAAGSRAGSPFLGVNCAAFPEELLESELFGYKRGAFTGAAADKKGLFTAAGTGTVFLDEVSEMSRRMQAKLLRTLQEKTVQPLGSTAAEPVRARIIGASNKDLRSMAAAGDFREDLFFRLQVMEICMPPLRERRDDLLPLISHFLEKYNRPSNTLDFSPETLKIMHAYSWPGNVRELENLIRRLLVTCPAKKVTPADLPFDVFSAADSAEAGSSRNSAVLNSPFKEAVQQLTADFEKEYLCFHLKLNRGNISRTAESIGISRVTLHQKINHYNLGVTCD